MQWEFCNPLNPQDLESWGGGRVTAAAAEAEAAMPAVAATEAEAADLRH